MTIWHGDGDVRLDVRIQVRPQVQIVSEVLSDVTGGRRNLYRAKVPSATPITLWTLDEQLGSYA